MPVLRVDGLREFFYTYMRYHAIDCGFNNREIAVAAEFLYYRSRYVITPLTRPSMELQEDGEEILTFETLTLIEQLKDRRTLDMIVKQLDMSFQVFRSHVQGLHNKGFFKLGDINKKFVPADNHTATFKVQLK